jgi:hypothetical protein
VDLPNLSRAMFASASRSVRAALPATFRGRLFVVVCVVVAPFAIFAASTTGPGDVVGICVSSVRKQLGSPKHVTFTEINDVTADVSGHLNVNNDGVITGFDFQCVMHKGIRGYVVTHTYIK